MTPIGHTLIGVSCGILASPSGLPIRQRIRFVIPFVLFANIPDFALKGWGHDQYYFSHSVFVTLGLIGLFLATWYMLCRLFKLQKHWKVAIGLSCAWLSHLLLDSFYNHGHGIRIFWPVSDTALTFPIPWLRVMDVSIPFFARHNTQIFLIEVLTFAPILGLSLLFRYFKSRKSPPLDFVRNAG